VGNAHTWNSERRLVSFAYSLRSVLGQLRPVSVLKPSVDPSSAIFDRRWSSVCRIGSSSKGDSRSLTNRQVGACVIVVVIVGGPIQWYFGQRFIEGLLIGLGFGLLFGWP
jgi:hypothetical protein